jgi:hypothetical protein
MVSWKHYHHWTKIATLVQFVLFFGVFATWIIRHGRGQAVNFWLLAVPVGVALLTFVYHLFRAPYGIYVNLYKEKETAIADLRKQLEPYLKKPPSAAPVPILVELVVDHRPTEHCHCRIAVHNKTKTAIENVRAELLGISPIPETLCRPRLPISLSPTDKSRIINANATAYFDFLTIEVEPGNRRVVLRDENGTTQSFEEGISRMLSIIHPHGYQLQLLVSSSNSPPVEKSCKLMLRAEPEDVIGHKPMVGYGISMQT